MTTNEDPSKHLTSAICLGSLEKVKEICDSSHLSNSLNPEVGYALLCLATENDYSEITKLLLKIGLKVNVENINPSPTPLHFAVANGDLEIVEIILSKNADINAVNGYGRTPLHSAVERNHIKIIEVLLSKGANSNARDRNNATPLHLAVERFKYLEIFEFFLNSRSCFNFLCNSTIKHSDTSLDFSVEKKIEKIIELLLNNGADVDAKGENDSTALHIATESGHLQTVDLLLCRGANVNVEGKERITALHIAAEKGYLHIIEKLLRYGSSVNFVCNSTSMEGHAPVYLAVINGHEKVVRLLLEYGAKVDTQDKDGRTILQVAVEKRFLIIVDHILKHNPDVNNKSNTKSLEIAVCDYGEEYKRIVDRLLQYGFGINLEGMNNFSFLNGAVEKGYVKIVEAILKYNNDANILYKNHYFKLLCSAIKTKQKEMVGILISYGADVNMEDEDGETPLFHAIQRKDLQITKLLLLKGAKINNNPNLLNAAVKLACVEIVQIILHLGADINGSDTYGRTALHFTCISKEEYTNYLHNVDIKQNVAELLLCSGANVNAQDKDGTTTLHVAAQKGYQEVVEVLLIYNAEVNISDKDDITPLHIAAGNGNEVIFKLLLKNGANVNAMQKNGITALHIAVENGFKGIVDMLLKCGAKIDYKVEMDRILLHSAIERNYVDIAEVLLKFGVDVDLSDKYGKTALYVASHKVNVTAVTILLDYGSDINSINCNHYIPYNLSKVFPHFMQYSDKNTLSYRRFNFSNSYYYCPPVFYVHSEIIDIFEQHIVKMKVANFYISEQNLLFAVNYDSVFYHKCQIEIESLKDEKITNYISLYDVLTASLNRLSIYARNEDVLQFLKTDQYKTKYPIYGSIISNRFKTGIKRKPLLEQSIQLFYLLFSNCNELPINCVEKILSYLSNSDLRILINSHLTSINYPKYEFDVMPMTKKPCISH